MLVLSRTPGTSIFLDLDILLTVESVTLERIKLRVSRESTGEVLSRSRLQKHETLTLDELNVAVTVVEMRVDPITDEAKVRLAIEAPRDVSVHRYEVYQAIRRELPPK